MEAKVIRLLSLPTKVGIYWSVRVDYLSDGGTGTTTIMTRSREEAQAISVGHIFNL